MANKFDEMRAAVSDAESTLRAADSVVNDLARLLKGRLRKVDSGYLLAALKNELKDFNAHTKTWKD